MAKQEAGNWKPYSVARIVGNVRKVLETQDIRHLNKATYNFIIAHMSFIAHYDLGGFQQTYADLRQFVKALQSSEYSDDPRRNLREADRQDTDGDFRKWYGAAYQHSKAEAMRGIVALAQKHESKIAASFGDAQAREELAQARRLAAKLGFRLQPV